MTVPPVSELHIRGAHDPPLPHHHPRPSHHQHRRIHRRRRLPPARRLLFRPRSALHEPPPAPGMAKPHPPDGPRGRPIHPHRLAGRLLHRRHPCPPDGPHPPPLRRPGADGRHHFDRHVPRARPARQRHRPHRF